MTADNDLIAGGENRSFHRLQIMQHVDPDASDLYCFALTNAPHPLACVVVAANGNNRRNRTQRFQDLGLADIAAMQNEINAFEQRQYLRTQKTMRVGNDTDNLARRQNRFFATGF